MRGGIPGGRSLGLAVTITIALFLPASFSATGRAPALSIDTAHAPILIERDADFTPENGVIAGNGTPVDPFVIAGWEMLLSGPPGIEIRNTSAYLVIRDVVLVGSFEGAYDSVILRNVTNARVENITSDYNRIGILLEAVRSAAVTGNQLRDRQAIRVSSSTNVTFARNEATGGPNGVVQVLVVDSTRIDIDSNRIDTGYGISIGADRARDLQIVNNTIRSYGDGITLDNVSDTSITSNDVSWLPDIGIWAYGFDVRSSGNVSLTANFFRGFDENRVDGSANISLEWNSFPGYLYGLVLSSSRYIVLTNNSMDRGGILIAGSDLRDYDTHRIDTTNTIIGRPVAYLHDCADMDFDGTAVAQVMAVNCQRIRLANVSLSHVVVGIHFVLSQNLTVENGQVVDAFEGLLAEASTDLTVVNMTMRLGAFGIHLAGSERFSIRDNHVRTYPQEIDLEWSTDGEVVANDLSESSNVALAVQWGQRILVSRNNVTRNHWGINVYGSTNVIVEGNTIAGNEQGITMDASQVVRVHHNEFLENYPVQARDYSGATNQWDDGYPSGGNFWSDYRGWDDCGGPAQDVCPGSDGLGDIPYEIDADTQDRYPLVPVNPANMPPVAAFSYAPSSLAPGIPVTFDAASSYDPEAWPLRYDWDFGDGVTANTSSASIQHSYSTAQTFAVTLTVTDVRGGMSTMSLTLKVGFTPVASFTFSPGLPVAGEEIRFDASASYDPDGTILSYAWSFGDGTYGSNTVNFPHVYDSPGSYIVELSVTDDSGLTSRESQTIDVAPPLPLVLIPYTNPSGFRLPIPKDWTVEENQVVNGKTIELVLYGPFRQVQTNILVDTAIDPSVRETAAYLFDAVNATVREAHLPTGEQAQITEGPTLRLIGGHAGVTFKLQYGASTVRQTGAIVVSEADHRYWVLVLTTDEPSYPVMDEAFGRMLDGFEITATSHFNFPWILIAGASVAAAVTGSALLVLVTIRRRRPAEARPIPHQTISASPPAFASRSCLNCGSPTPLIANFCPRCGWRLS